MKRAATDPDAPRAQALLVQRATEGLDAAEAAELDRLGAGEVTSFDLAAAAVDLATVPREPLPAALADAILASARRVTVATAGPIASPSTAPAVPAVAAVLPDPIGPPRGRSRARAPMVAAWAVAAAAAGLAVVAWSRTPARAPGQESAPPAAARGELLAAADDLITVPWAAGADPAGHAVAGDVVWSPSRQRGYLRLVGLTPNDPTVSRYQLWIVDRGRDPRYPVDGGLFDVASTGEVVVPIDARIPIDDPSEFLVTGEASAGVVVSDRARTVATATVVPRW